MKEVATLLNEMRAERVITEHALFGAVAQMRYTEPVATRDADVLVVLPSAQGLGGPGVEFGDAVGRRVAWSQRRAYGLRDEEYLRLKILTCLLPAF